MNNQSVEELWELFKKDKISILEDEKSSLYTYMELSPYSLENWIFEMFKSLSYSELNDKFYSFSKEAIRLYPIKDELYTIFVERFPDIKLMDLAQTLFKTGIIDKFVSKKVVSDDIFKDIIIRFKGYLHLPYFRYLLSDSRFTSENIDYLIIYVTSSHNMYDIRELLNNPNYISIENLYRLVKYFQSDKENKYRIKNELIMSCSNANFDIIYEVLKYNNPSKLSNNKRLRLKTKINYYSYKKIITMSPIEINLIGKLYPEIYGFTGIKKPTDIEMAISTLEIDNE